MKTILRWMSAAVAGLILLAGAGCMNEASNTTANRPVSPIANTNAPSAAPTTPEPAPPKVADAAPPVQPVTLPVLDAFFALDNFVGDLKAKLDLTDEQVNTIRSIARVETSKLRESESPDEYEGTTTTAREEAYEKNKAAIGEEKTKALIAFVNERWNGDVTVPPTIPTPIPIPPGKTPAAPPRVAVGVPQDRRVVVNAPAFRMDLFEGGELIKSYKIGIGYPEFPLPTGLRRADTIIFNPTWTPPDEPWVESPGSKVKVGEKIEAGDKLNPLGPIKIPIGLPSLIHGGKASAKLGAFASHGCVGLTNSQIVDFAKRLGQLGGTQISDDQIAEFQANKTKTRPVKLSKAVVVELRYETITVEDGKLHIYRDVYDRGTNTEENLARVLQLYGVSLGQLSEPKRAEVLRALGQMARDAGGKAATEPTAVDKSRSAKGSSSTAASIPTSPGKGEKTKNELKADNIANGKVTRAIKGRKEVVVEIPELLGQGYPAPVDLDAGVVPKRVTPRSRRRR